MSPARAPRAWILGIAALLALLALAAALAPGFARRALREAAARRGYVLELADLRVGWGPSLRIRGLTLTRAATADTVVTAESLAVRISIPSVFALRPRPADVSIAHARLVAHGSAAADPDTLAPPTRPTRRGSRRESEDHSARARDAATSLVRALLLPARALPSLHLTDVSLVRTSAGEELRSLHLDRVRLERDRGGIRFDAAGRLDLERPVPFEGSLGYASDDRLDGDWTFQVPDPASEARWPLRIAIDGGVHQDRAAGRVTVLDSTRVRIGEIALRVAGRIERSGPAFHLSLAADSLSGARMQRSLPPPVLGPLAGVATRGTFDYRAGLDLDLALPDSVGFRADVIPHGLALDPARSRLDPAAIADPFTAAIRLPRGRVVVRDLSPGNPHFLALDEIDPRLVHALVTNEDGGFFRHRGFNTDAVKDAIAENLRAGAFRRGAGTITMQLARNLWLGHARTLSRKGQEVILAWILEHLTGLPKERLLEIYLNIIEWGPEVHGADEAARFYFDRSAKRLSVDEALFLAILVPSPSKWKWRLDERGELRSFAREQMHFIGRAMIAKGWLEADDLPPVDQLRIDLRGPARGEFFPDGDGAAEEIRAGNASSAGPGAREGGTIRGS